MIAAALLILAPAPEYAAQHREAYAAFIVARKAMGDCLVSATTALRNSKDAAGDVADTAMIVCDNEIKAFHNSRIAENVLDMTDEMPLAQAQYLMDGIRTELTRQGCYRD